MSRRIVRFASTLAALMFAMPALAETGLHLSWDHCAADGRVANKAFACDTNDGSELLVLSFDPPEAKDDVNGFEITVHIKSSSASLPEWWRFAAGTCRVAGMSYDLSPAVAGTCAYPLSANAAGGIGAFQVDWFGPGSLRIIAISAVPQADQFAVAPGQEYFAFALVLRKVRTVGAGACGGCSTPVCIGFGHLRITGQVIDTNINMYAGGSGLGGSDATVTWQNAFVHEYTAITEKASEYVSMTCDPDNSAPARTSTWGAVKSLYR
jgi:hypothetical protein